jgi:uncharacterized protein (TIGR00255 family)
MIRSMTAFGNARADLPEGTLTVEIRSINSRFLDLHFRLPDELRQVETPLRELLTANLNRGKVEVRVSYTRNASMGLDQLDPKWLASLAHQLRLARDIMPDVTAPCLADLFNWPGQRNSDALDPQVWSVACMEATKQALVQLQQGRTREGQRLAAIMHQCAESIGQIVDTIHTYLPRLLTEHRERLATKLRETVESAFPGGFSHISGAEISERLSQEANLFALRIDVAEELARLRSHLDELRHLLKQGTAGETNAHTKKASGSAGKRLDFLFQEMNREANTLGAKASSMEVTRASMDLKLLIEQMREQAQNIE